jgi:Flp pilus assembly protein TadG
MAVRGARQSGAGSRRQRRGALSVEMAILAPILLIFLFGTVELGMIMRDVMVLNSAAREAARAASLGWGNTAIVDRARAAATGLVAAHVTVTLDYRTYTSGVWSGWATLASSGGSNTAPSGAQIRVRVSYPHPLIVGRLFTSLLATNTTNNTMTVGATMTMMRE